MADYENLKRILGLLVVVAPLLLTFLLGVPSLVGWRLRERSINRSVQAAIVSGLLCAIAVLALMLLDGTRHVIVMVRDWVEIPGYRFSVKFVFDRLSVPMAILSFLLSGTIAAFASGYMHRERGFNRFFALYALFVLGMVIASLAGTIETLFAGWEMVGVSSALLVAFYQERPAPARKGLRVWIVYRVSDAALLLAAVVLHHLAGEGDFARLLGEGPWPLGQATITGPQVLVVGLLLLLAAAGKSGLVPFSGWLPRAMEGPTPSSAIFYGALSVHLGAFLLLRVSPLLAASMWLAVLVILLGLVTALLAYLSGRVQTDIKSALSFACLSQVGLIVAEIGLSSLLLAAASAPTSSLAELGLALRYVALVHLLGHACLRTLQFVRAPTLLHDYHTLENAIGEHLPHGTVPLEMLPARRLGPWLYRLGLERGYLDAILNTYVVALFVRFFRWCDGMERRWTDFLRRRPSRAEDVIKPPLSTIEEFV